MSILGTLLDLTTESRGGDASDGVSVTTQAHSLPATKPEMTIMQLRSVEAVGANAAVSLLAVDANESLASIGYYFGSAASVPTIYYDTLKAVFWSKIR